jgi:predicted Zn-dependent peptidase
MEVVRLRGFQTIKIPLRVDYTLIEVQVMAGLFFARELAHLFEHLMGHWTSKRNPSAAQVNALIEGMGAQTEAETDNYLIRYWMIGKPEDAPELLDLLLEAITDFQVDPSIVKQERLAVIHELSQNEDDEWQELEEGTNRVLYGAHPAGDSLQQGVRLAQRATLPQILAQYKRYKQPAMQLLLAGSLAHLPKGTPSTAHPLRPLPPKQVGRVKLPRLVYTFDDDNTAGILLTFRSLWTEFTEEAWALKLIAWILTQGVTSRLQERLRSELGLIYKVDSQVELDPVQPELGQFSLSTSTAPKDLERVVQETLAVLREPIESIEAADKSVRLDEELKYDPVEYAQKQARQVAFGKREIKRASLATVQRVADQLFRPENLVLAYSAPQRLQGMQRIVESF